MLFEMISNGLNIMESITGDTLPEWTAVLLWFFLDFSVIKGLAEGIDTEFLAHGLIDLLISTKACYYFACTFEVAYSSNLGLI